MKIRSYVQCFCQSQQPIYMTLSIVPEHLPKIDVINSEKKLKPILEVNSYVVYPISESYFNICHFHFFID